MEFRAGFDTEDEDRLAPVKDDKLKDAWIPPLKAGSDICCHPSFKKTVDNKYFVWYNTKGYEPIA